MPNCNFHSNYIQITTLQGNPFDESGDYLTPPILFTFNTNGIVKLNQFLINDVNIVNSAEYIKSLIQTKSGVTTKLETSVCIYQIETNVDKYITEGEAMQYLQQAQQTQ
jgi:hypothetical protein